MENPVVEKTHLDWKHPNDVLLVMFLASVSMSSRTTKDGTRRTREYPITAATGRLTLDEQCATELSSERNIHDSKSTV